MKHYFKWNTSPFWMLHLACLSVFLVPFSWNDVFLAIGLYVIRMFFVTAGYHRYFSHRAYSTHRSFQFVLAFMAMTSSQKGVLWWAAHHRDHHRNSDLPKDVHSPNHGFWWSHIGWILSDQHADTNIERIRDFAKYPELIWLNRHWWVPVAIFAAFVFYFFGTSGFVWGFIVSTVALWHGTFTINSLSHLWGSKRFETHDLSRNNPILAIITLGEGWHNNHHRFPGLARNGLAWYEYDVTYYVLKILSYLRIVTVPIRNGAHRWDEA